MADESTNNTAAPAPIDITGYDAETQGYLKNRGLTDKPANEVILSLSQAHREAQKLIGGDEKSIIRLPKDANAPEWKTIRQRLGAPADPNGYTFEGVKFSDGTDLDENFVTTMRTAADSAGLSVQQANDMARAVLKHLEDAEAHDAAASQQKLAAELDTLKKNWGANFTVNKLVADNAAAKLGVTPEQVATLNTVVGGAAVMEMFRQIGTKIGEDTFVRDPAGTSAPMTREQAMARKTELLADKEWTRKLSAGDLRAKQEFDSLMSILAGVAA